MLPVKTRESGRLDEGRAERVGPGCVGTPVPHTRSRTIDSSLLDAVSARGTLLYLVDLSMYRADHQHRRPLVLALVNRALALLEQMLLVWRENNRGGRRTKTIPPPPPPKHLWWRAIIGINVSTLLALETSDTDELNYGLKYNNSTLYYKMDDL